MKREPGYYWVKVKYEDVWHCAIYTNDYSDGDYFWYFTGDIEAFAETDLSEINENRIPSPDEYGLGGLDEIATPNTNKDEKSYYEKMIRRTDEKKSFAESSLPLPDNEKPLMKWGKAYFGDGVRINWHEEDEKVIRQIKELYNIKPTIENNEIPAHQGFSEDAEIELLFPEITKEQRELINSLIALSNSKPELKEQAEGLLKTVGKRVYCSKVGAGIASLAGYEYVGKLVDDEIYIKNI